MAWRRRLWLRWCRWVEQKVDAFFFWKDTRHMKLYRRMGMLANTSYPDLRCSRTRYQICGPDRRPSSPSPVVWLYPDMFQTDLRRKMLVLVDELPEGF